MSPVIVPACNLDDGSFQADSSLLPVSSGESLTTTTDTCSQETRQRVAKAPHDMTRISCENDTSTQAPYHTTGLMYHIIPPISFSRSLCFVSVPKKTIRLVGTTGVC